MLQIFATSKDLCDVSKYSHIARPKASKATKLAGQHRKQNFDNAICKMLDYKKPKASKQARQQASNKFKQLKTKK
jgi:hypothetical protein